MDNERVAKHVFVRGLVQGVGFRAWTEREAHARGLSGWVKNLADGAVEALIQGDAAQVQDMLAALWHGPRLSKVEEIDAQVAVLEGCQGFSIRR